MIIQAPLEKADAIIVLSGSANYKERTREAANLLLDGRSQRILITSDATPGPWSSVDQRNLFFYERAIRELRAAGVPESNIELLAQPVTSTKEEADIARQYAEEHRLNSILVVTSPYHSRRAFWTFSRVFRKTKIQVGLISPSPGAQSPGPATWWLSVKGWRLVPTEYVKMIYYVIRY